MKTLEQRNIEELTNRLGRNPTEIELAIKDCAEEEAYRQIDATPTDGYVMNDVVGPHRKRLAEKLGREPSESEIDLFEEIYTEEIEQENMNREMRI